MKTSSSFALCSTALAIAFAAPARASGPVEQVVQVAFHPRDPDVIVLRYENKGEGLFFSDDGGQSWRLMCGDFAVSQLPDEIDPLDRKFQLTNFTVAGDGTVLGASFSLLWLGDTRGCTWGTQPDYDSRWVTDFAPHPSDPDVLFFATGVAGMPNAMVQRNADGSFAEVGAPEDVQIFRLRMAETANGLRIYQGAISGTVEVTMNDMTFETGRYVIRVSDDDGETFEEFEAGSGPDALRLVAVDPRNSDRIVVLHDQSTAPDNLLLSADRGATFTQYHSLTQFAGIAFAPDGRLLIAEEPNDGVPDGSVGLWSATSLDEPPEKISDVETFCVDYQAATDTFFACPRKSFGRVDPVDGAFTELFHFNMVSGFVECGSTDVAAACKDQLCRAYCGLSHFAQAPVCSEYEEPYCGPCAATPDPLACSMNAGEPIADGGIPADGGISPARDGGTPARDGGTSARDAGSPGGDGEDGCSCRVIGGTRAHGAERAGWVALALLLTFGVGTRARKRARRMH